MASKSASSVAVFVVLFLVMFEVAEIKAQADDECLREYGGNVGFGFCAPRIFPTICYTRCQEDRGAKGGRCIWGDDGDVKCLCDFCNDEPSDQFIRRA